MMPNPDRRVVGGVDREHHVDRAVLSASGARSAVAVPVVVRAGETLGPAVGVVHEADDLGGRARTVVDERHGTRGVEPATAAPSPEAADVVGAAAGAFSAWVLGIVARAALSKGVRAERLLRFPSPSPDPALPVG